MKPQIMLETPSEIPFHAPPSVLIASEKSSSKFGKVKRASFQTEGKALLRSSILSLWSGFPFLFLH